MSKRKKYQSRTPTKTVNSGYGEGGASRSRSALRGYNPFKSSVKADVDTHLPTLRARSNDMFINSPLGASAINISRMNVIGAGLKVSPKVDYRILGISPQEAKEWQRNVQREFALWAEGTSCDLYRKNNFYDMQDICFMSSLVDGDAWAAVKYRPPTPDNPYAIKIQLIEASRVSNPDLSATAGCLPFASVEMTNTKNGNRIISGVELNGDGAVVAYWIANRVPYDLSADSRRLEWIRVEAFNRYTGAPNVLQISHEERSEQYRGVPIMAPVIEKLKQTDRYTNAELTAAIVKSFFTMFFTHGVQNNMNDVLNSTYKNSVTPEDMEGIEVGPGTLNLLPEGVDVKSVDASRSMSTFETFTNTLVAQIGAALTIPSEVLLSRFQGSYSAARGALLQAQSAFKTRRSWFARDFCQPIYEAWLAEAVARGRIKAPGYGSDPVITKAWSGADWFGPVMGLLDPEKEVRAAALRIKYGLSTGEREAAEITGTDYDDNIDQLAIEAEAWHNAGLPVPKADNTGEGGGEKHEEVLGS